MRANYGMMEERVKKGEDGQRKGRIREVEGKGRREGENERRLGVNVCFINSHSVYRHIKMREKGGMP